MGTMTLWDRIWPWLLHPLSTAAAVIAFRYCEKHGLEIRFPPEVGEAAMQEWRDRETLASQPIDR